MPQSLDMAMLPRRRALLAMLALAGCGHGGNGDSLAKVEKTVACRAVGAPAFEDVCTLDHAPSPEGTVLTVHWPDGGFRRLLIVKSGQGVIAADGAEPVQVAKAAGDAIELAMPEGQVQLAARIIP